MKNYYIKNIDVFSIEIRKQALDHIVGDQINIQPITDKVLETYITVNQIKDIVSKHSTNEADKYFITEDNLYHIFSEIITQIEGSCLSKLCVKGYIDCCWDSEKNNMVFWRTDKRCS